MWTQMTRFERLVFTVCLLWLLAALIAPAPGYAYYDYQCRDILDWLIVYGGNWIACWWVFGWDSCLRCV